ncbi:MAG TPA: phosphotransferase family protein [Bradyrhizobium sp.]|nr:phosphotransferase family protein [Bradyrhizobium sp.]
MADGVRKDEEFSGTRPVEERHRIDEARLDGWMRDNVEGYAGPLTVLQFKGGQSNPTYRLDTPGRCYVMRRKPFGKLLPSAHAVDREFKVIAALSTQGFPVAKAYALCTDDAVIGAAFYIMSMEEGRVFWDPTLPSQTPDARRKIFTSKVETLAKLHQYDPEKIGLGDFGKPGNYFARQVDRWTKQYRASETQHIPEVEKLIEWLPRTVPEQTRVSIVHGDYRLDNMIFHSTEPRVQAVLDWELSTLGDPMADFTYLLMQWTMPGLANADLKALNIPTMDEAAAIYCGVTGETVPDLNWYFSYNLFRLAGITQGIAGRIRDGTAASAKAMESAKRTVPLSQASWDYAQKAGAK